MIRVCDFEMDSVKLRLAVMTTAQAKEFVKSGNEFLERMKREEVKPEEWMKRRDDAVLRSLNSAASKPDEWTQERLDNEFDLVLLDAVYNKVLAISGLKPGEAVAASASPRSMAA